MSDRSNRTMLRQSTEIAHGRAEAAWTQSGRFRGVAQYRAWLSRLLDVHGTLGAAAAHALGDPDLSAQEVQRLHALSTDLHRPIERSEALPQSQDFAWGVAYALNGSSLGASILMKTGAVAPTWPRAYLTVMGTYARSGALHRFLQDLNTAPLDQTKAIAGAKAVFTALSENSAPISQIHEWRSREDSNPEPAD